MPASSMHRKGRFIQFGLVLSALLALGSFFLLFFLDEEEVIVPDPIHRASLMERAFYDEAFEDARAVECPESVSGAIVNHHLLAKSLIAETLSCIDPKTKLIVVIGPNHFSEGRAPALLSMEGWKTPYGPLFSDDKLTSVLIEGGTIAAEEKPFDGEHAIGNLVAFLKRVAPDAKILPIILKDAITRERIEELAESLTLFLPKDAVIVGSFDFSHGLSGAAARHADGKSLAAVRALDSVRIRPLDIDSVPGLDLLFMLMRERGTERFTLHGHTNSAEITGQDINETTSYITGVYSDGRPNVEKEASLLVVGDVLLSRGVRSAIARRGFWELIKPLHRLFWGSDAVIGQLEGAVSGQEEDPDAFPPRFPIDEALLPVVRRYGFTHFSLSTNHSKDAGPEGLERTRKVLEERGIGHFGGFDNESGRGKIIEIDGFRIGLVGHHAFGGGSTQVTIKEIERMQSVADRVVVLAHWGIEGLAKADGRQIEMGQAFIDAGADVVLGSHPHVVQPMEMYNGKPIFYSLGNFIFDQIEADMREGVAVGLRFSETVTHIAVIPVVSENLQLSLVGKESRDRILKDIGLPTGEVVIIRDNYGE